MAKMKQYAMLRAMQDEEYQEFHQAIEYMNGRQGKLLAMRERKHILISGALRGKIFQKITDVGEIDLLEKKAGDGGKCRKKGEVPKWRR